ncbi:MAG: hypothetical protein HWE21_09695 [Cytophagia bacterium]|nr:hypothetical protein [Cytophagia bacterium]
MDSIHDTISYVSELMPDRIAFYSYAHVPWQRPGQRAYSEVDLPSPEMKRKLNQFGQQRLRDLGYELVGMDHFALPDDSLVEAMHSEELHRNFMGYTVNPGKLLIGLGVSSISDIHLAYAQNVKTVEGYLQQIQEGKLPVFKGHEMSSEDLKTKEQILKVACQKHFSLDGLAVEAILTVQDLIDDGLLTQEGNNLLVTETGNQYLRNICSLFDPNYGKKREGKVFSQAV